MKIVTVLGARPQFVKAAMISRAIQMFNDTTTGDKIVEEIIHTGQHFDSNMSQVFFDEMGIPPPKQNLEVHGGLHGDMTGRMLQLLEPAFVAARPDWVLVYGDTNSTLAGALAAAKLNIPVAHVEAGLRSFNRRMPEETNRVLTDHLADLLFAPTDLAVRNLAREGIEARQVALVGDVMYDAFLRFSGSTMGTKKVLEKFRLQSAHYVLATVHRAENTDDPVRLRAIFEGLRIIAGEIPVIMPLHPRTRRILDDCTWFGEQHQRIQIVDPIGYLEMLVLEKHAAMIASDSGGVQKEAYFAGVPCVTLRDETEWVELLESGWNRLCPPNSAAALATSIRSALGTRGREVELYGGGQAAQRIVERLSVA
jgi:UDP-GlcNAc3NAcA epimerase